MGASASTHIPGGSCEYTVVPCTLGCRGCVGQVGVQVAVRSVCALVSGR
jgi:hypothetical protein